MRYLFLAFDFLFLAGLTGCQDATSTAPLPDQNQRNRVAEAELAPADDDRNSGEWGTIKGQIVWGGNGIPVPKPLNVDKDQDHCLSKGPILSEEWVINKDNKGVRWTFVWLAPEPKSAKKLPIHPSLKEIKVKEVEIDQPCCAFVPHALGMREGQVLVAKNSAPKTAHNVHWLGNPQTNPGGNQSVPAGKSYRIEGLKADKLPLLINCDIHGWMKARVGVFDHPYFAVTDENGNFEIKLAPAGDWRLKIYHDAIGWRNGAAGRDGEKISIKAGETTDVGKLDVKPAE